MLQHSILGGVVDQAQIWSYSGNANWTEVGGGTWRLGYTPTVEGKIKLSAMLHIRSGDGNGHSRLYNKIRIVKVSPSYNAVLSINSESLWEGNPGYGDQIRFFDGSRTVLAVDSSPSLDQVNTYAIEIVAGDGLHTEVCYGSPFILEFHPD